MKIYLASSAPGNESQRERGMLPINKRLLSYYFILYKKLENDKIFKCIKYENKQKRVNKSSNNG